MNIKPQIADTGNAEIVASFQSRNAGLEPLQAFAERLGKTESAMESLAEHLGEQAARPLARLQRELDNFEPAVTFLGQVKSGKTTLVNAMAGWPDLLPADVNPWTSVVTSLHLIPGQERREVGARFQMMKENEWDRLVQKGGRLGELADRTGAGAEREKIREQVEALREKSRRRLGKKFELLLGQEHEYGYFDKNLLERYICLGDDVFDDEDATAEEENQGRFADITKSADLYLHSRSKPLKMCLRDTPGVNDTFMMREQVTINAVRSSRICVVVLSAHQALTSIDMGLIRLISNLQSRDVIIYVNRIDELRDAANEIPEIEQSIRQVLGDHNGPKDAQIIFGSAYWANMVLSGNIDDAAEAAGAKLIEWAGLDVSPKDATYTAADTLWHLSGLPKLQHAVSEQIIDTLGAPMLRKLISSAASIASGQQAANKIRIQGSETTQNLSMQQIRQELDTLSARHVTALSEQLAALSDSYQARVDRAHAGFIQQATASLVDHLEKRGSNEHWECSPTSLRMKLKSAYSVYAIRAQNAAKGQYENAVGDIAEFYFRAFGNVVEGIQLSVPETPDLPAPVAIAQTIALDFSDGWWKSWWRRTRGYKAFASKFRTLIAGETEEFMGQIKNDQTVDVTLALKTVLDTFIEQNRDILYEISSSRGDKDGLQRICMGTAEYDRIAQIDDILDHLNDLADPTETKAGSN